MHTIENSCRHPHILDSVDNINRDEILKGLGPRVVWKIEYCFNRMEPKYINVPTYKLAGSRG